MGFYSESELAQTRTPLTMSPQCGACGLYKTCRSPKMVPTGKGRKRVLIVGEAPGEREDDEGRQFVGKTGKRLRNAIRDLGYDPDRDCWFTNALICRPPRNATPNNDQIEFCRPNLVKTVLELNPDIIIPVGLPAVISLLGWVWRPDVKQDKLSKWVGWRIPCQKLNAWICPTYHPSYVERCLEERNPMPDKYFKYHLERAFSLEGKPWKKVPDYRSKVTVLHEPSKVPVLLKMLRFQGNTVAFDYETNMLKPDSKDGHIVCCSVSDGATTIAYPWAGKAIDATLGMLEDEKVEKVGFNIKFEERWTYAKYGVRVKGWKWCGMTGAHVLDNRPGISGLKFQSFVLLGQDSYDDHIHPYLHAKGGYSRNRIKEVKMSDLLLYCGMDSLLEYKVATYQMDALGYT